MTKLKIPGAWLAAGSQKPQTVTARIAMDEQTVGKGLCPACRQQMKGPVFCAGLPMTVCWPCRIAMPYKDAEHQGHAQNYKAHTPNPVPAFI